MSNGTKPTHTAGWATSKEQHQHPRGMQTHTYTLVLFPPPFLSHTLKPLHTHTCRHRNPKQASSLAVSHPPAHAACKISINQQLLMFWHCLLCFPPFLFSLCFPICCAYFYALYSCFPRFIWISPFSHASLRALPLLNHYQTAH